MSCLVAWVCLSAQVSAIVPTKDVETPFMCLKQLVLVSKTHSSHWSQGVYDVSCDYVTEAEEGKAYEELRKGFAQYCRLPNKVRSDGVRWSLAVNGVVYLFKFKSILDTIRQKQDGLTKIDIRTRTHLMVDMAAPIEGPAPKRWWKDAIYSGPTPPVFEWDKTVIATGGKAERMYSSSVYQAAVNVRFEDYAASMSAILRQADYEMVSKSPNVISFRNLHRHTYQVLLSRGRHDQTYVVWHVCKNVIKKFRELRQGAIR